MLVVLRRGRPERTGRCGLQLTWVDAGGDAGGACRLCVNPPPNDGYLSRTFDIAPSQVGAYKIRAQVRGLSFPSGAQAGVGVRFTNPLDGGRGGNQSLGVALDSSWQLVDAVAASLAYTHVEATIETGPGDGSKPVCFLLDDVVLSRAE